MENNKKSGLATAGLVLGIIAICTSFIPIINNISFFIGIIAVIFGIISLVKKKGSGKAIAALILGIFAIIITLVIQDSFNKAIDDASKDFDKATGNNTEEVLKNDADVKLGKFKIKKDEYGIEDTKLTVTLTNKTSQTKSFSVKVEAKDSNGVRIDTDDAYFDTVAPGQTVTSDIFNLVETEKAKKLETASFQIIETSSY